MHKINLRSDRTEDRPLCIWWNDIGYGPGVAGWANIYNQRGDLLMSISGKVHRESKPYLRLVNESAFYEIKLINWLVGLDLQGELNA